MKKITLIASLLLIIALVQAQSFERVLYPDFAIDDPVEEEFMYSAEKSFEAKMDFFLDTFLVKILHKDITKNIFGEDFKKEDFEQRIAELKTNPEPIKEQIENMYWYDLDEDGDLDVIINIYYDDEKEGVIYLAYNLGGEYIIHEVNGILIADAFYLDSIPKKILSYNSSFLNPIICFSYIDISYYEGPKSLSKLYVPALMRKPLNEEYLKKNKDYMIMQDSTYIYNEPDAFLDTDFYSIQNYDRQMLRKGDMVTAIAKIYYSGCFWLFVKYRMPDEEIDSEIWGWINAVNTDY
jgi:hypothetical protein